jgi:hypothetical protein
MYACAHKDLVEAKTAVGKGPIPRARRARPARSFGAGFLRTGLSDCARSNAKACAAPGSPVRCGSAHRRRGRRAARTPARFRQPMHFGRGVGRPDANPVEPFLLHMLINHSIVRGIRRNLSRRCDLCGSALQFAQSSTRILRRKQRNEVRYPCVRRQPFEFLLVQGRNVFEWNI